MWWEFFYRFACNLFLIYEWKKWLKLLYCLQSYCKKISLNIFGMSLIYKQGKTWKLVCVNVKCFVLIASSGNTHIGLIQTCLNIYNRSEECFVPDNIQPEWMLTFVLITGGVTCVTITILLLACSYWRYRIMRFARWSGFIASELL